MNYERVTADRKTYNKIYAMWKSLFKMTRESEDVLKIDPAWYTFKPFYEWYMENDYPLLNEPLSINYNILDKQSKLISPKTCILIPKRINDLFQYRNVKNRTLPHGVVTMGNRYSVSIRNPIKNTVEYYGSADTPEDAFEIFRVNKTILIHKLVQSYGYELPNNIYNLLMSYQVSLDD